MYSWMVLWFEYPCCIFHTYYMFKFNKDNLLGDLLMEVRDFDTGSGGSWKDHLVLNTGEMYSLHTPKTKIGLQNWWFVYNVSHLPRKHVQLLSWFQEVENSPTYCHFGAPDSPSVKSADFSISSKSKKSCSGAGTENGKNRAGCGCESIMNKSPDIRLCMKWIWNS